jgi:SPP1 gp7 family putative phage head morphogenesis protein
MCWVCATDRDAYTIPARGFVTLWPYARLDTDRVRALAKAAATPAPAAPRWAVVAGDGTRRRLVARTTEEARTAALTALDGAPGVLARFVAASPQGDIYELTETLVHLDIATAAGHPAAELVGINGVALAKQGNPFAAIDLRVLTQRLSSQLVGVERKRLMPVIRRYLERLDDVDWTHGPAVDRALRNARNFLARTAPRAVLPSWSQRVKVSVQDVATKTRIALNETYLPSLSTSLAQPDIRSVNRIAQQNGWFLRDEWGRRADGLTTRGRAIVQQGLVRGLGKQEIGRQLQRELPGLATQYGRRYAATAASVAVSRARSYTEVSSYAEVGIEYLEVQAVLDERTTEICRALDGTIIEVQMAQAQIDAAANVARPEDIYRQSPFMRVATDGKTGDRNIVTNNGAKIARVVQSGVGRVDDRGRHEFYRAGRQLGAANIGPPPYHHLCRSWTVPRSDVRQVPRNYGARTIAPAVFSFNERLGRRVPDGRDAITKPPVEQFRLPKPGAPVVAGSHLPIDDYRLPVFREDLPGAQRMARATGDAVALRVSPHDYKRQGFTPGSWKFTTPGSAHDLDALFGVPGTDAVGELFVKGNRNRALASALANPSAQGRDMLLRVADVQGKNVEWIRARLLNTPGYARAADNYRRAVAEGRSLKQITIAAEALLDVGQARGWLARSADLARVTEAQTARVRAVSRGTPTTAKPKRKPPAKPAERQPDTTPQPAPTRAARPTVAPDVPLHEVPVTSGVYAARPDPQAMVSAVWNPDAVALASAIRVEANTGKAAAQGAWRTVRERSPLGTPSAPIFEARAVELEAADKVASVFLPIEVTSKIRWMEAAESIARAELGRGYKGIRDWVLTDARGKVRFIRIDGSKLAAAHAESATGFERRLGSIYNENDQAMRALGITTTDRLADFYPRATVDWGNRNLIPGVPVAEQVERRIAAVRAELTERINARAANKGAALNIQEVGAEIRAAVRETAAKGSATAGMRASNLDERITTEGVEYGRRRARFILRGQKEGREFLKSTVFVPNAELAEHLDRALGLASDGLRAAVQTRPIPDVIATGSAKTRAWCSPRKAVRDTSIIKMPHTMEKIRKAPRYDGHEQYAKIPERRRRAAKLRKDWEVTFAHEVQHHVDGLGLNREAMRAARARAVTDGEVRNIYGNTRPKDIEVGLPGKYQDKYDGKVYEHDRNALLADAIQGTRRTADEVRAELRKVDKLLEYEAGASGGEYSTMARQRLEKDTDAGAMWQHDPDQAAFITSVLRGHYTPY